MQDVLAAGIAVAEQQPPPPLRCPRCESTDTKFCYYNNYNLSQPRHFCKACRRYWTVGGALRNVPVGGASRKPKSRPSPYSRPSAAPTTLEAGPPPASSPPPLPPPPPPLPKEESRVLDVFASDCQFENLLEGSAVVGRLPPSLQSSKERGGNDAAAAATLPTEDLLGTLGDSSCWANWWPDLAIE